MQIVGIAGKPGSGVHTLAAALAKNRHWLELPLDSTQPNSIAHVLKQYQKENSDYTYLGLVVTGISQLSEVAAINAQGGRVIWIDAEPRIRFGRVTKGQEPYAQFLADDSQYDSLKPIEEKAGLWIANNGVDKTAFEKEAAHLLGDDLCCAVEFD